MIKVNSAIHLNTHDINHLTVQIHHNNLRPKICNFSGKRQVTYQFLSVTRHNDANNMTTPYPFNPFYLRYSQNFNKIDSLPKPEEAGILHQIFTFGGAGSIKVKVGIFWDRLKHLRRNFLGK